ncbi:MAG: hypothetical protein RR060_01840 [Victivallaceae bacterium]
MKFYTATLIALGLACSLNLAAEDAAAPVKPVGEPPKMERPNFEKMRKEMQEKREKDMKINQEYRAKYLAAKTDAEKQAVITEFKGILTKRMQDAIEMQKKQIKKMTERVAEQEKNLAADAEKMSTNILTRKSMRGEHKGKDGKEGKERGPRRGKMAPQPAALEADKK